MVGRFNRAKPRVAVAGVGMTEHRRSFPERSWKDLLAMAVYEALDDAGMTAKEISAGIVSYQGESEVEAGGIGPVVADYLGICPAPVHPITANCAGGTAGICLGYALVASGVADCVLVAGFARECDALHRMELISVSSDTEYDYMLGFAHTDGFGLLNQAYERDYGYTIEPYARFAVQCDWYAKRNPKAVHFRGAPLSLDEAMQDTPEGYRLREGASAEAAAAVLLVSAERALRLPHRPVYVAGVSFKNAPHYLAGHLNYQRVDGATSLCQTREMVRKAANEAYRMAGVTVEDINLAQVYDGNAASLLMLEGLGIFSEGEAGRAVMQGQTAAEGRCPTCTDGGRIRCGTAAGARGVSQVVESAIQLRGEAGERQVRDALVAACANMGGVMAQIGVMVLTGGK